MDIGINIHDRGYDPRSFDLTFHSRRTLLCLPWLTRGGFSQIINGQYTVRDTVHEMHTKETIMVTCRANYLYNRSG